MVLEFSILYKIIVHTHLCACDLHCPLLLYFMPAFCTRVSDAAHTISTYALISPFMNHFVNTHKHEKNQTCTHTHKCVQSGSSSLGCGVANGMLSSVFPAGHLTVTLFPSWPSRGGS